jgi:hypothetical protein
MLFSLYAILHSRARIAALRKMVSSSAVSHKPRLFV